MRANFRGMLLILLLLPMQAIASCLEDKFIAELTETGDDFRAVTIIKEREFVRRGKLEGYECARALLGRYLKHREFDLADQWLNRMISFYPQIEAVAPSNRLRAELAYLYGNFHEVERRLEGAESPKELAAFANAVIDPLGKSRSGCDTNRCRQLDSVLQGSVPQKSPILGLLLGLVPGMGQVYAGRTWAGIGSFVVNSIMIGATAYGVSRGEYAFSIVSGVATAGLYMGSIYAGYEATKRFNESRIEERRAKIRGLNLELKVLELAL